ncbi:hypothetical protein [Clostridium cylindrosporum]|uniref:Uncharacterized protein n=1 Tax=Clostridium cylindrosporum DSM 605 TaxID=1121307 RepID=A0A0J8D7Z9_CLOCY|nr:hypothetical protein [Clostridium cylindrosporum]KMT22175.1 hypothetical protein CLCY_4c01480 [Clostridium cylindrosporum DSM 605]
MLQGLKLNLEELESMLYFWQATSEKEKVSEVYLTEISNMEGLKLSYKIDSDLTSEGVRKVLSSITNREILSQKTKSEARLWNFNMWMLEDLEYTNMMIAPLKQLNIDDVLEMIGDEAKKSKYEDIEVRFSPLSMQDYIISGNKLVINFFKVRPSLDGSEELTIDNIEIKEYIKSKTIELMNQ